MRLEAPIRPHGKGSRKAGVRGTLLMLDHAAVLGGAEWSLYDIARHRPCSVLLFEDGPLRDMLLKEHVPCAVMPAPNLLRRRGSTSRAGCRLLLPMQLRHFARQVSRRARGAGMLYANSLQSFLVAAEAGRHAQVPVIWHLREMLSAPYIDGVGRRLCVRFSRRPAVYIIANSHATARTFVDAGGAPERLSVIHNGVEVHAAAEPAISVRWNGSPVVGMFARLARWKGHRVLLDALALMPGVHAVIAGAPLFESPAYAAELKQRAAGLDIDERVHFVGHRSDVHALMQSVDIVVHASVAPEPFGRVIVEAMHLAKPVVATDTGGVKELITHGKNGILIPPADASRLASAVMELLNDKNAAAHMGRRGAAVAAARFSLPAMLAKLDARLVSIEEAGA